MSITRLPISDAPLDWSVPSPREIWHDLGQAWRTPAVGQGLVGSALVGWGSLTPAMLPPNRPYLVPWMANTTWWVLGTILMFVGLGLLVDAWLALRPVHGPLEARSWAALAWWSVPLLLAPPLFSNDAYSYAAQGRMVIDHIDPYVFGANSGSTEFLRSVDEDWHLTPAPYGPMALKVAQLMVMLGKTPWWSAIAMRLPAILAVLVLAAVLPRLARRWGMDPDRAAWWGVLNPLVLLNLVGGAHNDAPMLALVALGLYFATDAALIPACMTIGLAATFKQSGLLALPAAAAVSVVVARHRQGIERGRPSAWTWVRLTLIGLGSAGAVFAVVTWMTGLGYGWVHALWVPAHGDSLSPVSNLGSLLSWLVRSLGWYDASLSVRGTVRAAGMVATLAVWLWLGIRTLADPRRAMSFLVGSFLAITVLGTSLRPWYLLTVTTFVGLIETHRHWERFFVWATAFMVVYPAMWMALINQSLALGSVGMFALLWLFVSADLAFVQSRLAAIQKASETPRPSAGAGAGAVQPRARLD